MKHARLKKILFVLLLLILLPALLYTGYEISRLSDTEEEISRIYEQQLDAVLFSINQYSWDITGNWMNSVQRSMFRTEDATHLDSELASFMHSSTSVNAILLFDSTGQELSRLRKDAESDSLDYLFNQLGDTLLSDESMRMQLLRFRGEDYQKIEPVLLAEAGGTPMLAMISAVEIDEGRSVLAALCISSEVFIDRVLGPKFQDIAGNSFILFCVDTRDNRIVLATSDVSGELHLSQSRRLWLFPHYEFGIRLKGKTLEEVAKERFIRNSLLFLAIDLLLLLGVAFVYRNIRREVELAQLKSDFVSNVSHELKTPLALIRMYAETLDMDRVPEAKQKREYYSVIVQETERLSRLINNILTFSRIEAGRKEYHMREVNINRVVKEVMAMYGFHLEHKGFAVEVHCSDDLPRVMADEEAVAEAVINLLDNAMKYSTDTKEVRVSTGRDDSFVFVAVRDRGIGIASEHQQEIFEKFYRVSEGLVHTAKGSGLGLSLIEHIMNAHDGRVDLESTAGEGSCFRLCFPYNRPAGQREKE